MIRVVSAAFALVMALPALAQANGTAGAQPTAPSQVAPGQPYAAPPQQQAYPPQQQAYPPQQQAYPPQQQAYPPQQQAYPPQQQGYAPPPQGYAPAQPQAAQPVQPPRYPDAQTVSPAPAGTGSGSQQVVVTPPPQPAAPPPPAPTVNVNPPASSGSTYNQPLVVQREAGRNTLETVAVDAGYGALAGALVGAGISLIDQGSNLGRNLMLGAGAGILVGAAVGAIQAYNQGDRVASDGLGSPERDRLASVGERTTVFAFGGHF